MITINATGDTTLHTAGKYCTEDILVKVPASGGETNNISIVYVRTTAPTPEDGNDGDIWIVRG